MDKQKYPKISIIIPVYNTGIYLKKCLDSIINQTFQDFEVIIINDGSSDNSMDILNEYSLRYDKFKIYSQDNSGVAITRNFALSLIKGEYIIFIDSDDFVEANFLDTLYNEAIDKKCDIVMCSYYRYFENINLSLPIIYKKRKGIFTSDEILKALIPDNLIHSYLWNKLWRKEIFDNFQFPDMKFEDLAIMCILLHRGNKISIINDKLYYYRIRSTSIVRNYSVSTQNDYIKAFGLIRLFLDDINSYDRYKFYFKLLAIKVSIVMFFANIFLLKEYKNFKLMFKNIKNSFSFISKCKLDNINFTKEELLSYSILEFPYCKKSHNI